MTTLNLALDKRASVLDGLTMIEVVPKSRLNAVLKSGLLLLSWGEDYNWDFHKKVIMETYENERTQIQKYYNSYNKKLGSISVKYYKPKHKWGRSFPFRQLGLSSFRKVIRNSLIQGLYYDFDIKNAQPQIIRNMCESNNIPCPIVTRYCNDRDRLLQDISTEYNVSCNTAKELFIRLCFFGSFNGWSIENKLQGKHANEFIISFERELKDIALEVKKHNPSLYETARKKKEDNGEQKENKVLGSFFALWSQEQEARIVESILCYLINNTDLMKVERCPSPVGAYEYDGIKLLKENVDCYDGGVDAVVELLIEKTKELTGFDLVRLNKEMKEFYDLTVILSIKMNYEHECNYMETMREVSLMW